jgi:hypothetical protein
MIRQIKIQNKNYDFSYSFDYKFSVIQGSKEDLKQLSQDLKNIFCNFDLVNDWSGFYIRLYGSIHDTKKLLENR